MHFSRLKTIMAHLQCQWLLPCVGDFSHLKTFNKNIVRCVFVSNENNHKCKNNIILTRNVHQVTVNIHHLSKCLTVIYRTGNHRNFFLDIAPTKRLPSVGTSTTFLYRLILLRSSPRESLKTRLLFLNFRWRHLRPNSFPSLPTFLKVAERKHLAGLPYAVCETFRLRWFPGWRWKSGRKLIFFINKPNFLHWNDRGTQLNYLSVFWY